MIQNIDRTCLLDALTNKINSALITADNHSYDNSFVENRIDTMLIGLNKSKYFPAGICKDMPFISEKYDKDLYIVFAFYDNEELYWIHFSKIILFSLLRDEYGYKKAEEIYDELGIED